MSNLKEKSKYVTTPIYYVNDKPHIGHAYTSILADVYSRYQRMQNKDCRFLTGTDEHGQKIAKVAAEKNTTPQELCDIFSEHFRKMASDAQISNDDFIRTTSTRHKEGVVQFWQKIVDNDWVYKGFYRGWYSVSDEAFYTESELVDGKAPTGSDVEYKEEESYFFRLSEFQNILLEVFNSSEKVILPAYRKNEVTSFIRGGLEDLSVSRVSIDWGIPIPSDQSHVIYVWLDALTNYISALGYPEGPAYKKYWQRSRVVHFMGKDILRFHSVYWFSFLIAEKFKRGSEINLESVKGCISNISLAVHGWWTSDNVKISKSRGNAIDPYRVIEEFGLDKFRFFLLAEMPFGNDGNYSKESFVTKTNAALANNIGNLAQRVMSFVVKHYSGTTPNYNKSCDPDLWDSPVSNFQDMHTKVLSLVDELRFQEAVYTILEYASQANEFIDHNHPWALKSESEMQRRGNILYILLQAMYGIATIIHPIVPNAASKILAAFGNTPPDPGSPISEPGSVFSRILKSSK